MNTKKTTRNSGSGSEKESVKVLDSRALNRATLARQMLLCRADIPVLDVVEKLIGLQAQALNAPYFALWSRMENFQQEQLSELIRDRKVVRMALMRSTLHLVSAPDTLQLRPWLQGVMERSLKGAYGQQLKDMDLGQLAALGRKLVEDKPMTSSELGQYLLEHWPELPSKAATAAIRNLVPLVQIPPRGIWGESGQATHTSLEAWLGQSLCPRPDTEILIRRYLAAFGPATVKDIQVWSGLTGLNKTIERLRPELVTFRDAQGAELFDLPDAPRPDGSTPAEPRFLGEFDNILLSYADRSRILDDRYRSRVFTINGIIRSTILIDGYVSGTWKLISERKKTVLSIESFISLSQKETDALMTEGARLLHFAAPENHSQEVIIHPK
ncbi:winged helix DNA-binding domain-containing protein [Paenibacillus sp. KQZ6P-2]|uniref:Winged helix DNA-binding domain-containing protein n=1 Tax=Paenibacillus mangrovi TaxID=2931978 RepID=A0A9X1WXZ0_9BACL|nr:winged helix DNA-binding domain-containing protein [Paenibacillus mangrovi]MCJ8014134.1 winged helix DNA-binding domain-containing protein [Paenibacillus mangrovi]